MSSTLDADVWPEAQTRVLVIGDVMTDIVVRPVGPLIRGADRRATIRSLPGGSGANQAAWLGHFGVPVTFVARVGEADLQACSTTLGRHGVVPRLAGDPRLPTGSLVAIIDPDGERSFLTDRGANDALQPGDLPETLLDGVGLLHVSGYALVTAGPRAAVLDIVTRARSRHIAITVDPGSTSFLAEVGAPAFLDWTSGADFCFPNDAEAATLAQTQDRTRQRAVLAGRYGHAVIKRGSEGAELVRGGAVLSMPAPLVETVDTTGAGDAFLAAFIAGLFRRSTMSVTLRGAIEAGSAATRTFGGRPPLMRC